MAQVKAGYMIPFTLKPSPAGAAFEGPLQVSVEAPAELIGLSEDGTTGFVGNRSTPGGVSVKFTADGDGIADGTVNFDVHYETMIDLLAADATGIETNVFGDAVPIT